MRSLQLHNVTLYLELSDLRTARDFYRALFNGGPVWEEDGHIACFGTADLAICLHEQEAQHPAGTREFFFWTDDLDGIQLDVEGGGGTVTRVSTGHDDSLRLVDPAGNDVRVHRRRR